METLVALLDDNVVLHGDGGGKALALKQAVVGASAVARLHHRGNPGRCRPARLWRRGSSSNGAPGLVATAGGRIVVAIMIDTDGERIHSVFALANPDKLGAIARGR